RGLAPLCAVTSHVQSSLPGCPQPVVSRPSHRETPAPHPASLLSRRSRLLHNHATPCCAPLLWATERALRTLPSPRARSRCRRRAARGGGRKALLFYLSVPRRPAAYRADAAHSRGPPAPRWSSPTRSPLYDRGCCQRQSGAAEESGFCPNSRYSLPRPPALHAYPVRKTRPPACTDPCPTGLLPGEFTNSSPPTQARDKTGGSRYGRRGV